MPKRYVVPVEIEEFDDGEGYLAICPVIPGCHAQGATIPEALENLEDVARILLELRVEDGFGLPEGLEEVQPGAVEIHAQIVVPVP